jgi:hypothetical protein
MLSAFAVRHMPLGHHAAERLVGVDAADLFVFPYGIFRRPQILRILLRSEPRRERFLDDVADLAATLGCPNAHGQIQLVVGQRDRYLDDAILPSRWLDG